MHIATHMRVHIDTATHARTHARTHTHKHTHTIKLVPFSQTKPLYLECMNFASYNLLYNKHLEYVAIAKLQCIFYL